VAFSFIHTCPANTAACAKHEHKQRLPVAFPHDMHMENYDCEECHHVYDENKNNIVDTMELYSDNPDIMCSSCHASNSKINTQEAFHRQCIGCHNKEAAIDEATGPIMCNGCHHHAVDASMDDDLIIKG